MDSGIEDELFEHGKPRQNRKEFDEALRQFELQRQLRHTQLNLRNATRRRILRAQRPQGVAAPYETPRVPNGTRNFIVLYKWYDEEKLGPRTVPLVPFIHCTREVRRNEPCPCGSLKKNKRCCNMARAEAVS